MGLSQEGREQRGYEALSRAAVTGLTDELPPPAGLEDSQQLQIGTSSACSTDSGTECIHLYFLQWLVCRHCCICVQLDQTVIFSLVLPDIHSFPSLQTLPDMIASTQRELLNGIKHKFLIFLFYFYTPIWKIFILKNTCISSLPPSGHSGALCEEQQHNSTSYSEQPLNLPPPGPPSTDDRQTLRHALLSLLLSVSLLAVRMLTWASG